MIDLIFLFPGPQHREEVLVSVHAQENVHVGRVVESRAVQGHVGHRLVVHGEFWRRLAEDAREAGGFVVTVKRETLQESGGRDKGGRAEIRVFTAPRQTRNIFSSFIFQLFESLRHD